MYTILEAMGEPRGVALVIHGLNLKPERMRPLADELRQWGIAVVLCALRGLAKITHRWLVVPLISPG